MQCLTLFTTVSMWRLHIFLNVWVYVVFTYQHFKKVFIYLSTIHMDKWAVTKVVKVLKNCFWDFISCFLLCIFRKRKYDFFVWIICDPIWRNSYTSRGHLRNLSGKYFLVTSVDREKSGDLNDIYFMAFAWKEKY